MHKDNNCNTVIRIKERRLILSKKKIKNVSIVPEVNIEPLSVLLIGHV